MADININEVYEELKYLGELPETSRLIKDYLVLRKEIASLRALVKEMADILKITSKNYFECEDRICILCGKKCGRNEAHRLINEAREVANGQ